MKPGRQLAAVKRRLTPMKIHHQPAFGALPVIIAASLLTPFVFAQIFPTRAVRTVVAYAAGGRTCRVG
jgi:hypothetical protein